MKIPAQLGSIEFKAVLPPAIEDELILTLNELCEKKEYLFYKQEYRLAVGMTRTTVIFKNLDTVLKIPHSGIYIPVCKHFDDIPKELYYKDFKDNYCKKEINFWKEVIPNSIKVFFVPLIPIKLNDFFGRELYLQSKVEGDIEMDDNMYIPKIIQDNMIEGLPRKWVVAALRRFGNAKVYELLKFLQKYPDISEDLADNNVGYIKDIPVIIDYAGLYEY